MFRSSDGGDTWESLNEGLYWDVHTVVPAPAGPDLYATTGAGFHVSSDSGAHWEHVPMPHRYTVPLLTTRADSALLTVAAEGPPPTWTNGVRGAIYRSKDGGRSWDRLGKGLPQQLDKMARGLIEDGAGRICAAVGSQVIASEDGGESWQVLVDNLPEVRDLVSA